MARCKSCKDKELNGVDVTEKKCKACGKTFFSRFSNICYDCQINKHCVCCGKKIK